MNNNIIQDKSYQFALRIIKLCLWLKESKHFELSSQLLRSGTSIGANVEEALAGHSRKDFLHKMNIARKEARETNYWLRLLLDSDILSESQADSIFSESEELVKILTSIVKTGQERAGE
ncbi:MAG: four helix bundle protein [Planctomycetales bacterium]|nr:four helix bundle protein [Planctomycetales bacterium]